MNTIQHIVRSVLALAIVTAFTGVASAAEPQLSDYTSYPIFTVNPVKPNILIILDNSGSMNFNAYGSEVSDGGIVTDQPYTGAPYQYLAYKVAASADDAEEQLDNGNTGIANGSPDLDLGRYYQGDSTATMIGLRFQGIQLPDNAKVTEAWLEFTIQRATAGPEGDAISLEIAGEDSDNAVLFKNENKNISNTTTRPETDEKVTWGSLTTPSTDPWTPANETRKTPNLNKIVQEVIDRDGWKTGNAIAFKIKYKAYSTSAKRDVYSYDGSQSKAPVLHIRYEVSDPVGTRYYGYFNPDWFYAYSGSKFKHAYKKVKYSKSGASATYPLLNGNTSSTASCWNVIYPTSYTTPGSESSWNKACLRDTDIVTKEVWDGNWMNWAAMRRIDIARKVIVGGKESSRQGGGNTSVIGENPAQKFRTYRRKFDTSSGSAVTPYSDPATPTMYGFKDGEIWIDKDNDSNPFDTGKDDKKDLKIDKRIEFEELDFDDNKYLSGVMQKFWNSAYWGNEYFLNGTGKGTEGGKIDFPVGSNDENLITALQNKGADTWTPLAESYYIATQYFKQQEPEDLGFAHSAIGSTTSERDPYYHDKEFVPCAKSFVILLTDGASTKDSKIPSTLKDYDGDGVDKTSCNETTETNCDYPSGGTDFLDDVALYARTNDLRSQLDGDQNLILYTIYAFGNDPNARDLLRNAARNGGFDDRNGNKKPDGDFSSPASDRKEWDKNGDGNPDTYFEAQDGYKLETELSKAINDILEKASSGTAVSVLATSSEGEGHLAQAYFRPIIKSGDEDVKWAGYLQSLWVDAKGNMREDTNANKALDLDKDQILRFITDSTGNTSINKYAVDKPKCYSTSPTMTDAAACLGVNPTGHTLPYQPPGSNNKWCRCIADVYPEISYVCSSLVAGVTDAVACAGVTGDSLGTFNNGKCLCKSEPAPVATVAMDEINPIWEAGSALASIANPDDTLLGRKIFTAIDGNDPGVGRFGGTDFTLANVDKLTPYFGIKDTTAWKYLGEYVDDADNSKDITQSDRAANLIRFVRGSDTGFKGITDMRNRTMPVKGVDRVWRLGDIVHSTPVTLNTPLDNYGLIYKDEGYQKYLNHYRNRETVVYVGANDGMLHAFTSLKFDEQKLAFKPLSASDTTEIGSELWAYIPKTLLPHLKWLPREDYTHVYYVDLKPKIVDAKIFTAESACTTTPLNANCIHPNGWGTVLIGGLRMGGKPIPVTDNFDADSTTADSTQTFASSYFAIDITDPRNPKFLWEKSYDGLAFTTSRPAVIKVGDKWHLVFGSGPTTYDGTSSQKAKMFVVDLATGVPYKDGTHEWRYELPENKAFMGGVVSIDYGLNYNVDAIYVGQAYDLNTNSNQGPDWRGSMYRIAVPWACETKCSGKPYGTVMSYDTDGNSTNDCDCLYDNNIANWKIGKLFDSPEPITIEPSLSSDFSKNVWIFFGTGRYLSQADKSSNDYQFLYGIKDPFFNLKHSTSGNDPAYHYPSGVSGSDNYFHDNGKTLTLKPANLFNADLYELIYPWGYYEAPEGDCSSVPTGQVGDIYNDGSCIASYDWPKFKCSPTKSAPVQSEIDECTALSNPVLGINNTGTGLECYCNAYTIPLWGCVEKTPGGCDDVPEGVVADTTDYKSLYWKRTELTEGGCDGVNFGTIATTAGCISEEVTPPTWSYVERPAGNCTAAGVKIGDEGDLLGDGGSCRAGYWTCTDVVVDGCDAVDYTTKTGFLGANGDGNIFGNNSCKCQFVEDPVAKVYSTNASAALTFQEIVKDARLWEGWQRKLPEPGERSVQKPAVLGGISLFTSYVPSDDICSLGGHSYLYGLYFETGTAYNREVFKTHKGVIIENGVISLPEKINLGIGMASSPSIHVGQEAGNEAKVFIEQSTGVIKEIDIDPALNIRSGLRYWQQK